MSYMCLIWFNMHLFCLRLVLIIPLSLWDVMKCTLLHFPVSFWLEMAYKSFWTVVGSFMPMLRIQTLVLCLPEMHDSMGFYFLIDIYMSCCNVHSIVLQLQRECLLVEN